jgi:carbamoyl-phosphate synthase large subunit
MRGEHLSVPFAKMHGCGNDYIYFNCFEPDIAAAVSSPESLSVFLSDRHIGIGGDGVILIMPPLSPANDARMRMFNLDGSEGSMCGNGIRCIAKFLYDKGIVKTRDMRIETLAGVRELRVNTQNGKVSSVRVNMGSVEYRKDGEAAYIDVGNPHRVLFVPSVETIDEQLKQSGADYPQYNNEFVTVVDPNRLQMRVWERGSGETFACGTGTCASVIAAVEAGYCELNSDVRVSLRGGELSVLYDGKTVYLTGDAHLVYEGNVLI